MNTTLRNVAIVVLVMIVFMVYAELKLRRQMRRVHEFLMFYPGSAFSAREICTRTGVSRWDIYMCLGHLQEQGDVECTSTGTVPYYYLKRTES